MIGQSRGAGLQLTGRFRWRFLNLIVRRNRNMGLLERILRITSGSRERGIHLDVTRPYWEVSGETDFPSVLTALPDLLPSGCLLYFEDGSPSGELSDFLQQEQIPQPIYVEPGSWPWPKEVHIPATPENTRRLAELSAGCASPELAVHFHVYRERSILLEWHDVFSQPMLLSSELELNRVIQFAERLNMLLNWVSFESDPAPKDHPASSLYNQNVPGGPPSVS